MPVFLVPRLRRNGIGNLAPPVYPTSIRASALSIVIKRSSSGFYNAACELLFIASNHERSVADPGRRR